MVPDWNETAPMPAFFAVMVHVPSPLSIAVAMPGSEKIVLMVPDAPSGEAFTVTFTVSFTLQLILFGVTVMSVMLFPPVLMVPVVSS